MHFVLLSFRGGDLRWRSALPLRFTFESSLTLESSVCFYKFVYFKNVLTIKDSLKQRLKMFFFFFKSVHSYYSKES